MTFDSQTVVNTLFARSRARAAAFGLAACVMLVPANLLPVMTIAIPGKARTDTIFSGVVSLFESGLWPLALIVFTASFLVPGLKLVGLAWLIAATHRPGTAHSRRLTHLYRTLDFIGRWSMLDVFLVAFLTGAVQFGRLATVEPRPGIIAFAAAVVLTMLATAAFDPRLLWRSVPSASISAPGRRAPLPSSP
jgi:paraquat-inducible protein A